MANTAQVRKIQIMRRDAGVQEQLYREQLRALGVESSKDLDNRGVDAMVRWLGAQGATDTTLRVDAWKIEIERRYNELQRLGALAGDPGSFATPAQRWGFNRRQCGLSWPQSYAHGMRIIEGQKQLEKQFIAAIETEATLALIAIHCRRPIEDLTVENFR
jgi:hypothetical protein